jgi:hypothetical protein
MTQEDRKLLLKDLSGRLPYFTKVQIKNEIVILDSICDDDGYYFNFIGDDREGVNIENIKPYLFPISSMTEEEKKEFGKACELDTEILSKHPMDGSPFPALYNSQDWLDAHHFDYRGLIPMGLAIDATNLNVY